MKSINLGIKTVKIEPKTRKLRASFTREMVSDLIISNSFDMDKFGRSRYYYGKSEKSILSELRRDRIENKIISIFEHDNQWWYNYYEGSKW